MDLTYSDVLYRDLSIGLDGLLLNSYLHLVYLVTPYDMVSQCKPDWMTYFRQVQSQCRDFALKLKQSDCKPVGFLMP